jgi:diacylglycerol kinase family enzyme
MDLSDQPRIDAVAPAAPAEFGIVLNAASGRRNEAEFEERLANALGQHADRFSISRAPTGKDLGLAIRRSVEAGHPVLVAAGGDGTITAVAEAAAADGRRLGILPSGTFNFVARGLGIPEELDDAVRTLVGGTAQPTTVAEVNGRLFLNNASLGLYPAILREREGIYRRWGRSRIAAHWSVVRAIFGAFRPLQLRITVDGRVIRARTPLLFVARSAFQLDRYGLEGGDAVRAGRFALFLVPDVPPLRLFLITLRLALGGVRPGHDIELITCDEITVESARRRLLVARDGERGPMASPLTFRLRHDALQVIAPEPSG